MTPMQMKTTLASTLAALLLLPCAQAADNYKIDPAHTSLNFSVRHMGISTVKGHFDDFAGSVTMDDSGIQAANGTVQVKSVNTGVAQRDTHLRTADLFDATNYPVITFKTKSVEHSGGQTILVADFTMRGVTKELRLPVTVSGPAKDPFGNTRIGLDARTILNRKDYGLKFSAALETGALLVGEEVTIEINAEAVKQAAGAPGNK
jgi:polyisoprenoid-binding protein YceI